MFLNKLIESTVRILLIQFDDNIVEGIHCFLSYDVEIWDSSIAICHFNVWSVVIYSMHNKSCFGSTSLNS